MVIQPYSFTIDIIFWLTITARFAVYPVVWGFSGMVILKRAIGIPLHRDGGHFSCLLFGLDLPSCGEAGHHKGFTGFTDADLSLALIVVGTYIQGPSHVRWPQIAGSRVLLAAGPLCQLVVLITFRL